MNIVHSEELGVTITGNMITRHNVPAEHLGILGTIYGQIGVVHAGGKMFVVSSPMNEADHREFAGLIHRLNSENKLNKKVDTKGDGPDNDGPKPTNPRGSGGKVVEFENILAIAA